MKSKLKFALALCLVTQLAFAGSLPSFSGMYIQWGYNTEVYTRSNIHFSLSNGDNFTLHSVKAHDRPNFEAIVQHPFDISIPQYNYRFGFYLNPSRTKALELNFDHAKYVVTDYQIARVSGTIDGKQVDQFMMLDPYSFIHFEHTDGANWLHINYIEQKTLVRGKSFPRLTCVWKAGAGINIPRTDIRYKGDRLNNNFHIAGVNASLESGFRYYPAKKFFFELTGKSGYVNYINALANTSTMKGNRARHQFGYAELILTFGFDLAYRHKF